ncbi:MAG TPA: fatty acid desaturase [Patescibacteria group bacterium]|nr:fatty acid desaturase [Patescibacteria group bacterium]
MENQLQKTAFKKAGTERQMASNVLAIAHLILPIIFAVCGLALSLKSSHWAMWFSGQLLLGIFFFQCFILLHETGHYSFFKSRMLNKIFGHVFGFLSFIPFKSWTAIHNLHHRWTGWRDKDPTTEGTVSSEFSRLTSALVNVSWRIGFPLFTIGYRLGNYWNRTKLKKYLPEAKLNGVFRNQVFLLALYAAIFVLFGKWILVNLGLAYFFSLMISDIIILSQHSHIDIPVSGGEDVQPVRYVEQIPYTRSLGFNAVFARMILLNFNLHELHHAQPGVPAYHLDKVALETPNTRDFRKYLLAAKKMKGVDFVFKTTSKTGLKI